MTLEFNEEDHWPLIPHYRAIPPEFHSLELDGPFAKCMICETDLMDAESRYFIERIFRGSEPIVEYAMCFACQANMCSELSEASQQSIQAVFERVDHEARLDRLRTCLGDGSFEPWIDECLITGKKRKDCRGYQIVGVCEGADLQLAVAPFMLSDDAVEQILRVISKQTRDRLDDFTGEHFGMPPEFCERPDFFPVII